MHWGSGIVHGDLTIYTNLKFGYGEYNGISLSVKEAKLTFGDERVNAIINSNNLNINNTNIMNIGSKTMNINTGKTNINSILCINNSSYGTTLPTRDNSDGRLFFKLIN